MAENHLNSLIIMLSLMNSTRHRFPQIVHNLQIIPFSEKLISNSASTCGHLVLFKTHHNSI